MANISDNHTAILLFARSAKEEAQHKKLSPDDSDNLFLLDSLKQHAYSVADQASLPLFHFSETKQIGSGFGERLTNSLANVFGRGYENVIVIGADCPDISVSDIHSAEKALACGQMVLGPDMRGGTFLLGLTAEMFERKQLASVSWQTSELLESLRKYADCFQFEITYLAQKFDLNVASDVIEYGEQSAFLSILLRSLHLSIDFQLIVCLYHTYLTFLQVLSRRGPPLMGTAY
ncbi:MAG: DUF2064 domain-containing protein [Bacteroidota bacterium]